MTIQTDIGDIQIEPTERSHIYVHGNVTIRGKTRHFAAHFHMYNDGQYRLGDPGSTEYQVMQSLHVSGGTGTSAFKQKLIASITPVVNAWVVVEAIEGRKDQISQHEQAIAALYAEIAVLDGGNNLDTYSKVPAYHFVLQT